MTSVLRRIIMPPGLVWRPEVNQFERGLLGGVVLALTSDVKELPSPEIAVHHIVVSNSNDADKTEYRFDSNLTVGYFGTNKRFSQAEVSDLVETSTTKESS